MPGFQPPEPYIREMKRYHVVPADFVPGSQIDPYETDRVYWKSFGPDYVTHVSQRAR